LLAKPLQASSFSENKKYMTQSTDKLPASHSEEHMLGHGFYNKHSHEQGKANTYALPLIVEAINRIDLAQIGGELRIADYGSAQGQNSLLPMKTAIAHIRARAAKSSGTAIPIDVTHTDLPTNDWSTLFQTVLFSPDSYLAEETDVFCFASGTSIYQQIFPPNHIAFGYSAITEDWLSRKPCDIPNEIWSVCATGQVRETWAAQAKADWHAFLEYRALEMQPSAQLLIVGSGADAKGNSGAEGLIDLANHILQQLVKDGTLYPSEYEEMAIPTYYRTAQEWKEPFTSESNFSAVLSLDHFEEVTLPDVYLEQFQQNGNAQAFAKAYTGFFKAAYEPCLFVNLSNERTAENRQQVIDLFSQRLQSALAQDPAKYSCRWVLHLMLISKKQK
jgi:SAM dependent carboxyl methyltransferase